MAEPARVSRGRRVLTGLRVILSTLGLTALFGIGATGALLAHLNLPASRRVAGDAVGELLASLLQGHIKIGSLSRVRPYEVVAEDIVVRDTARRIVLKASRLTARADLLDILKRVLRGDAKLTIIINHVRVERVEATIVPDEHGVPTIAQAFMPRPSPPSPPSPDDGGSVRVWLPAIELGQGFARGSLGGPTIEADVSGVHGSVLVTPKGAAVDISSFALVAKGLAGADARGIASLHVRAPGPIWAALDGYFGDVQFGATMRYDEELDIKLDVPRADPGAVRALIGTWPLLVPTQVSVRAKGKPPDLSVDLNTTIGESSTVAASGNLHLADPLGLQLELEGRKLDLRAVAAGAPATAIDVDTDFSLSLDAGRPVIGIDGSLYRTRIEQFDVPAIDFSASTQSGPFVGQAKVHEVGLDVDASFSVFPDGKLELEAEAKRVNLAQAERLRAYFDGSGYADVRLRAALERGRLDSKLTLDMRELAYQGARLQSGRLVATVRGPVDRPEQLGLDVKLTGKGLAGGGVAFDDVEATARGPLLAPNVTASLSAANGPSVDAQATVALGDPLSLRELSVGVQRNGVEIRGDIAQLDIGAERVVLRDLQLRGATGELHGDGKLDHGELAVTAHGKDVDLSAFSRVLGLPRGTFEGQLSLDVEILADSRTQTGKLDLSLRQAAFAQLTGVSGQLSAKLDGQRLTGELSGKVEALGSFSAGWDTQLAGRPVERAAFERATGTAKLALKDVTLEYLGQFLPDADVDVGGTASASLELSRQDGDAVPDLAASVETHDLHVTIASPPGPALEISRIELLSTLTHTGATGSTALSFGATRDGQRLLSSSAEMTLDLRAALAGRESLQAQLERHPLQVKAIVNELQLDSLPDPLRQPGLRGTVRLEGTLRGTIHEPTATLAVRAANMRFAPGDRSEPVDLCATAEYAKASGAFTVGAEAFLPAGLDLRRGACTGKRIATARWSGLMPLGERGYVGWTGTLLGSLENMPLAVIPPLAKAGVSGAIDGRMLLDRSGAQPSASVELGLKGVKVDRLVVGDGTIGLRSSEKRARAEFLIRHGDSALEGQLNVGLLWPTDVPELDSAQPIDVSVRASRLQASVLEPFVEGALGELGGILDVNLNARLDALTPGKTERTLDSLDGRISLQDGSFLLTGLGFRLRDVGFTATATRDGKLTLIEIPAFVASANARTRNMSAYVRLQLRGLSLEGGQARVSLTKLPLVMDGVTRANADARFNIDLQRRPEKMLTQITFEKLQATLLKESTRELVELKEHPNVVVLQPLAEPKARRDEDALPWHFVIHLGEQAKLVRPGMLDVTLTGDPNVVLAQDVGVTGAIYLRRGGAVQMLGKIFLIEGGGVFFDSADAGDPRLDVQASWRAPDGDTLFLFVTGTASKPKLRFDRPDEQAWAMLLGGDASDITTAALDTLLADTPLAGVSVRKSSAEDDEQGATYTASYRLGEKIIVEGNYQEAQSTGAYQTEAGVGAAVDWRMTKSWSLRGQLGTIGTGVDLLYQYRY